MTFSTKEDAFLWVEGKDDKEFVWELRDQHKLPRNFRVKEAGSVSELLSAFELELTGDKCRILGLVLDANKSKNGRWQSITNRIKRTNPNYTLPLEPNPNGTIIEPPDAYAPRIGIWIMPDNQADGALVEKESPLAHRMRPRTLDEYVGQTHIIGPGRLLRRAIQADQLSSLIFYGPPGTGKTTLAMVIANSTQSHFITINAVLAGVKEIREAIADAQERRNLYNQRTTLFVDEVHRWNKAQQDALLPHVENGTIILIGATTENPYFEVNKALVSRSRIFQLRRSPKMICARLPGRRWRPGAGLRQPERTIEPEALDHLVDVANGDARGVLNALELAMETTEKMKTAVSTSPSKLPKNRSSAAPFSTTRKGTSTTTPSPPSSKAARLRPRRRALLDGQNGLRRRRPPLHLPPHDHLCRRRCGPGRSAGDHRGHRLLGSV
jgi:adenylate kinase family enzyme